MTSEELTITHNATSFTSWWCDCDVHQFTELRAQHVWKVTGIVPAPTGTVTWVHL